MKNKLLLSLSILISWLPAGLRAQPWSGIIDPARAIDWSSAGVVGGIPSASWTQCGPTIAAYGTSTTPASPAAINSAIAACGSNQYVQLGAGTFWLTSGINFGERSNVVLRGMGANQTTIIPALVDGCGGIGAIVCAQGSTSFYAGGGEQNVCDWTSGFAQGSTSITLSNCGSSAPAVGSLSNLKIGSIIVLDQVNEITDTGKIWNCAAGIPPYSTTNSCSSEGGGVERNNGTCVSGFCDRSMVQLVTVTNCTNTAGTCTSGSNITISPPIYMPNWRSGQAPQAFYPNSQSSNLGIENLLVSSNGKSMSNNGSNVMNLALYDCYNCWIKGVASIYANRAAASMWLCLHCEVRDSYFFQGNAHGSSSYGVEWLLTGSSKVENNIAQQISTGLPISNLGGDGNVAAYNYVSNTVYTTSNGWSQPAYYLHAAGDSYGLWEGNVGPDGVNLDDIHGTHHLHTFFRNYFLGWQQTCNGNGSPCLVNDNAFVISGGSRYINIVGNVLGTAGYTGSLGTGSNAYTCYAPSASGACSPNAYPGLIYNVGYGVSGNTFCATTSCSSSASGYDPLTQNYLMLWGNWDVVSNATRWCGNSSDTGWASVCGSTSEVPTTVTPMGNAVPTRGDTGAGQGPLPASFLYSSMPSWWGNHAWPTIGPDVTNGNIRICSGGSYGKLPVSTTGSSATTCTGGGGTVTTGLAGHVNLSPAMDCYLNVMGGPPDGSGPQLSFNAASCYQGTTTTRLQPPANVSSSVN